MKKYLFFIGVITALFSDGQTFVVRDRLSNMPVENVIVKVNGKVSGETNFRGEVKFKSLKENDKVSFQRVDYEEKSVIVKNVCYGKDAVCFIYLSPKKFNLNEVIVSASKFEESKEDVPVAVSVISAREIQDVNPQNTADVLQKSGELFVQKSQMGGGSPVIRGFETNKILLVYDGIRMNNAIYRGGHLQNIITTDPFSVKSVEVVYGPGTVIYGSDALGGVINLHTFKPLFADTSSVLVTGNVMSRFMSADQSSVNSIRVNVASDKFSSLSVFSVGNFGNLRQGNIRNPFYGDWGKRYYYAVRVQDRDTMIRNNDVNMQVPSAYSQINFLQKLAYKHGQIIHSLNFYYTTSTDIPRYDRLSLYKNSDTLKYAEWYYGPQKWLLAYYKMESSASNLFFDKSKLIFSYQNYLESRHVRKFADDWRKNRYEKLNIFGLNLDFQKDISGVELRYGASWYRNYVNSTADKENIVTGVYSPLTTRYPDGGSVTDNAGIYLAASKELGENFVLNSGIRFNYDDLYSKFDDTSLTHFPFTEISLQNNAVTGNLGIVYKLKQGRMALNLSTGYRSPNVDDISKVFDSQPGLVVVPNPDLKEERTYNVDFILEKEIVKTFYVSLNPFYTFYKDAITLVPFTFNGQDSIMYDGEMSKVIANDNAQEAFIYGLSSKVGINLSENFELYSLGTYTYGRIITDTSLYPLDHIPPFYGKTALKYSSRIIIGEFYLLYNGWKYLKDYNVYGEDNLKYATQYGTPAWCTLNFTLTVRAMKSFDITVGVENITDVNYRPFASGISAPGRNLILKVNGWF